MMNIPGWKSLESARQFWE